MSTPPPPPTPEPGLDATTRERASRTLISEDWLATIVGLALLLAAVAGLIPVGLVP